MDGFSSLNKINHHFFELKLNTAFLLKEFFRILWDAYCRNVSTSKSFLEFFFPNLT